MRNVTVENTLTYKRAKLPGGWTAKVPEPTFDEESINTYALHFQRLGATPMKARALAIRNLDDAYVGSFITRLRMAMGRWALKYLRAYGDLDGFDPEYMQQAYLPFENTFGRRGKPYVRTMFEAMRKTTDEN